MPTFSTLKILASSMLFFNIQHGFSMEKKKSKFYMSLAVLYNKPYDDMHSKKSSSKIVKCVWRVDKHSLRKSEIYDSIFDSEETVQKWLIQNKIPALGIGVISHGQLREIKVYGNYTKGKPAPFNTIWNVASLTKPVTAILALKLISMGKLSLDEPLYKYWIDPDIADDPNTRLLTARIILSHQTGFSNWRFENKSGKLEFQFKPGTKFQYSGEGFEYLKKALENKFHKTLDALAAEFIFEPLKLRDTHFFPDAGTDFSRFAIGFDKDGNEYQITKNNAASAADDLITTIGDYGTFLCSVMKGDGLDGEIFNEMISVQADMKQDKYFGLGFKVYDLGDGNRALSHGGSDKGVQTLFFILPKTKQGLILFTNSDQGSKIFASAITHFLGEKGKKIVEIEMR